MVTDTKTPEITVVIASRGRPYMLPRALRSVIDQEIDVPVRALVVIDDWPQTRFALDQLKLPNVQYIYVPRGTNDVDGPARIGYLRNLGTGLVNSRYVAFLDDDNAFKPDHLQNLLSEIVISEADAVHSWRQLVTPDGEPYKERRWPWAIEEEAEWVYRQMVRNGHIGLDNVVHDSELPPFAHVDTNTWLIRTQAFINGLRWGASASEEEMRHGITEDVKLLRNMKQKGLEISCVPIGSVLYTVGTGYTTRPDRINGWYFGLANAYDGAIAPQTA